MYSFPFLCIWRFCDYDPTVPGKTTKKRRVNIHKLMRSILFGWQTQFRTLGLLRAENAMVAVKMLPGAFWENFGGKNTFQRN